MNVHHITYKANKGREPLSSSVLAPGDIIVYDIPGPDNFDKRTARGITMFDYESGSLIVQASLKVMVTNETVHTVLSTTKLDKPVFGFRHGVLVLHEGMLRWLLL